MEIHSCDTSAQTFLMVPHLQLSKSRGLTVTHRICLQDLSAPPSHPWASAHSPPSGQWSSTWAQPAWDQLIRGALEGQTDMGTRVHGLISQMLLRTGLGWSQQWDTAADQKALALCSP